MTVNPPAWLQYFDVLSPTIIAFVALVITAGIQWRMLQVARQKNKMDLFDRRYALYEKARSFISLVLAQGDNYNEKSFDAFKELHAARFLFKPDVHELLLQIAQLGDDTYYANEELKHVEWSSEEGEKQRKKRLDARKKLIEYANTLHKRFEPYLAFGRVTD